MKRLLLATIVSLFALSGAAAQFGLPSLWNQYAVPDFPPQFDAGYSDTTGRVVATPSTIKTKLYIAVGGQSLAANYVNAMHNPTNVDDCLQLNIYDGLIYKLKDPVLGSGGTGGSYLGYLCDALITAGKAQQIIFLPFAVGGTGTFQWLPGYYQGYFVQRIVTAYLYARKNAWPVDAFIWDNGNTDGITGISQAQYESNVKAIQSLVQTLGYSGRMFIAKETMVGNVTNATIQAAQDALVDHSAQRWSGANTDSLTGGTNRYDGTHLTATGAAANAALWVTALGQVFP